MERYWGFPRLERRDKRRRPYTIRVCPAHEATLAALGAMYDAFEPKELFQALPPRSPERRAAWLKNLQRRGISLVAEVEGEVVGHAALIEISPSDQCEYILFVHQAHQDRGIGTGLSRAACALAREIGYVTAWLTVQASNPRAMRVYQKVGFRVVGPPDLEREMKLDLRTLPDDVCAELSSVPPDPTAGWAPAPPES